MSIQNAKLIQKLRDEVEDQGEIEKYTYIKKIIEYQFTDTKRFYLRLMTIYVLTSLLPFLLSILSFADELPDNTTWQKQKLMENPGPERDHAWMMNVCCTIAMVS